MSVSPSSAAAAIVTASVSTAPVAHATSSSVHAVEAVENRYSGDVGGNIGSPLA
jgi:hypothetical protein